MCTIHHRVNIFLILTLLVHLGQASVIGSPVSLAVTIYNDQFAMVKDVRTISFDQNRSELYFTDVSSTLQPETVTFKALDFPQFIRVYEQNFEANLISTKGLLKKYINEKVMVYTQRGGKSIKINGILLGFNDGYILKTKTGIQILENIEGIRMRGIPQGFFTLPTLNWKVYSEVALTTECQVAYRTTGFSWKSDYSIILNDKETKADFGGWVTIDNRSGKRYLNAKLKLIAGEVNTIKPYDWSQDVLVIDDEDEDYAKSAAPSFSEKSFSDYHLYTLSQPVTLNDNSEKQIEFIPKVYGIKIRKYNQININTGGYSQTNLKASNKIEFFNSQGNGLGLPLPKGTVRVFKTDDSDNSLEFIGEDSIDHTPKDENLTITTGNAFDITANKITSNFQSFSQDYSADHKLTVSNHKSTAAEIVIELSNRYHINLKTNWKTPNLKIEQVSSTLWRITRVFNAEEQFAIEWSEDQRS